MTQLGERIWNRIREVEQETHGPAVLPRILDEGGRYRSDWYRAVMRLENEGRVVLSWDRRGRSLVSTVLNQGVSA